MPREDGGDGRLDQRGAEARDDGRGSAEDRVVEHLRLRKVGDLGGTSDVGGGGQEKILKNGAQQGVGTDALGSGIEDGEQVQSGEGFFAGGPIPVLALEREVLVLALEGEARAGLVIDKKQHLALKRENGNWT